METTMNKYSKTQGMPLVQGPMHRQTGSHTYCSGFTVLGN